MLIFFHLFGDVAAVEDRTSSPVDVVPTLEKHVPAAVFSSIETTMLIPLFIGAQAYCGFYRGKFACTSHRFA